MSRFSFSLIVFIAFVSQSVFAAKNAEIIQDKNCTIETCRASVCIYICSIDSVDFNRYVMEAMDFEKAYATWLEITRTKDFPLNLPKENTQYQNQQTTIKLTWQNKQLFDISLYERGELIGNLQIYNRDKNTIIDDKLHLVKNY